MFYLCESEPSPKAFRRLRVYTQHAMKDQVTHMIVVVMVIRVEAIEVSLFLQVDSDASVWTNREGEGGRETFLDGEREGESWLMMM